MLSIDYRASTSNGDEDHDDEEIRDIHALTPPPPPPPPQVSRGRRREAWETSSHRSSSLSTTSEGASSENFTSMSREFNALLNMAGSAIGNNGNENDGGGAGNNLGRIGEEEMPEETNPLAIVPDTSLLDPVPSPRHVAAGAGGLSTTSSHSEVSVQRVKKEEVDAKISAWQTAKIAKINNRFKREDAIINGWRVKRKLEEKRARALEKMQNDVAKAHRKAEERRASAEAKRGTKVARVLELANLMRAVGRAPVKRSIF
ncbi:Remorin 4.1 [Vitis vinifera]|uniref:Remorin 4.1 n=1 Tax=Vitis vinifera TaxID=29760 RepID=A0A438JL94_VITVI|nr:Remorin 4.1 [Vitis vinifera]